MPAKRNRIRPHLTFFILLCMLLAPVSCGTRRAVMIEGDRTPGTVGVSYQKVILNPFEADSRLAASRPGIAAACEDATLRELMKIGSAPMILKAAAGRLKQENTLIVRVRLTSADGKTQGRKAKLAAHVRLIDASTGKTLAEEDVSAAVSSRSAPSDNPNDLGRTVAQHIDAFIRIK